MRKMFRTLVLGAVVAFATAPAANAADRTAESATWLLRRATLVHRDGMHNILLRALRQMGDPDLEPLFRDLAGKRHPVLRVHGILGLGEIDAGGRVDLSLVAEVNDAATQAQLVSAAIEGRVLGAEEAKRMFDWPGLDPAVQVVLASKLVSEGELDDGSLLSGAAVAENPALRGMAAMLQLQLGDGGAIHQLRALDRPELSQRDEARLMVLQAAIRHDFEAIGPWALELAMNPRASRSVTFTALRAAMRFEAEGAAAVWTRWYDAATSHADRIRLAVLALDVAEKLPPEHFGALLAEDDPVIRQIGRTGEALASGRPATSHLLKLLDLNHLLAGNWVLQHAMEQPIERGWPVLVGVIRAAEAPPDPPRFRSQRLENTVLATQQLAERAPEAAAAVERLFRRVPPLTAEAMLMGMIRSGAAAPHRCIEGVGPAEFPSDTAAALALLLRAKHGAPLDEGEMERLGLIVRGGAGLQDPLRVQAAWLYLKLTNQDEVALASVLAG